MNISNNISISSKNVSSKLIEEASMADRNSHNLSAHNHGCPILEHGQNMLSRLMITNCFGTNLFCGALHGYTAGPSSSTMVRGIFHTLEFERKICRVCFKNSFAQRLPSPGLLDINFGLFDAKPTLNSSQWIKKRNLAVKVSTDGSPIDTAPSSIDLYYKKRTSPNSFTILPSIPSLLLAQQRGEALKQLRTKSSVNGLLNPKVLKRSKGKHLRRRVRMAKQFLRSGVQVFSSDWVLEGLINQIQKKRSVYAVMNECIRDVQALLNRLRSACPVLGVRITASGRLGKQKKGMAKKLTVSIGKVPNGTFSQKIGYSQGFVVTKFGLVGLKVTVAFR